MKKNKMFRQGDILIERIDQIPEKSQKTNRENGRLILARGEKTFHHHAITAPRADLYSDESGVTALEVKQALALLQHEEHATIPLKRGTYRVIRQREYTPEAIRNVAD